jgi:SAM-dependent methyltransferase
MDRDEVSAVTHDGLPFANPLAPHAIDDAVAELDLAPGSRVLDVGCGAGELLTRIKAGHPHVTTAGIEPAPARAEAARGRVDVVHAAPFAEVALDRGAFGLVCCLASSHAIGTWDEALRELHALAAPGGLALVGEGFWRRSPSPGYLAALGGATEDELPDHDGLVSAAELAGWELAAERIAADEDWAAYEETLIANGERRLATDPDPDLQRWVDAARARWDHPDGRNTLGFALLTLRRAA